MFIHLIKGGIPECIINDSEVMSCVGFPSGDFICILKQRDLFSYVFVDFLSLTFLKKS